MLTGTGNFCVFFATLKLGLLTGDAVIGSTGATDDISKSRFISGAVFLLGKFEG